MEIYNKIFRLPIVFSLGMLMGHLTKGHDNRIEILLLFGFIYLLGAINHYVSMTLNSK